MKKLFGICVTVTMALAVSSAAQATTYDYAADFSILSNPNGAWSYGAKHKDGNGKPTGTFELFDTAATEWFGMHLYMAGGDTTGFGGETWKNETNDEQYNISPGHCSLNGDAYCTSTARWIAPVSGYIDLTISFGGSNSARYVMHNDTLLAEGNYQNASLYVNAGDAIDATTYGAPGWGNTQTDITIIIPEPATVCILSLGLVGIICKRRIA